ncbi:MAG: phosphonate metabolism transcriptional regulator PhnF [Pseudomonadota bacterium]
MGRPTLWKDIAGILEGEIASGILSKGDQLPTEAMLSDRFGVNRHTVRRALSHLIGEGLIYSKQGAGAFVTGSITHYPIGQRVRFHQNVEAVGRHPSKRALHLTTRRARSEEAAALDLSDTAEVHYMESVAMIDGEPVSHSSTVFPAELFPNMIENLQANPSITAAMATEGVRDFTRASTQITAVLANATSASLLQIPAGAPLLRTRSISVDPNFRPVEFGYTWFAGEKITLDVEGDQASQS